MCRPFGTRASSHHPFPRDKSRGYRCAVLSGLNAKDLSHSMSNSTKTLLVVFEFDTLNGGENSMLAVLSLLIDSQWQIKAALPLIERGKKLCDLLAEGFMRIKYTPNHIDNIVARYGVESALSILNQLLKSTL